MFLTMAAAAAASATRAVQLIGGPIEHQVTPPGTAFAGLSLDSNGGEYHTQGGIYQLQDDWLLIGLNSDYEVRASATGDTPSGAPLDTWLPMTTTRNWELTQATNGVQNCTLDVDIRRIAGGDIVESAQYAISVERGN